MHHPYLDPSWEKILKEEFSKPYLVNLLDFLREEVSSNKKIYPDYEEIFHSLNLTPFEKVKVVILGQDPYHGPNQAHGLSFSVRKGVKIPPSLVNIYKELADDMQLSIPAHGNLEAWAHKGVLLLNNVLTVEDGKAGSHHKKGWETFTDKIVEVLNSKKENLVFILWGAPAQKKASIVDSKKHCILKSVHPSPLSVYRGFYGSKPFSEANQYLESKGLLPINWTIT